MENAVSTAAIAASQGYTLNGVVGRIQDLEHKVGGAYYVAMCWLAMNRSSGKGSKAALETKVFGKDKPTSTFRNAWRIAEKAFAVGFHDEHRKAATIMGLDDAVKFAVKCLEDHKAALGVSTMKDYEDVCKYASVETVPAPEPEVADEPKGEGQTEGQTGDVNADGKGEVGEVDIMANMRNAFVQLTLEQANEFVQWASEHILKAVEAADKVDNKAEGNADFDPAAELAKAKAEGNAKRKAA